MDSLRNLPKTERNEEIYRLRRDGVTFADLGRRFGISPTRAQQICWKYDRWSRGMPVGLAREESEAWIAKMNQRII